MAKEVAGTLTGALENPVVKQIMDRSKSIVDLVPEIKKHWSMDLYTRKPGPAVTEDGKFVGTDLDLATFMMALVDRGAVISLPTYKSRRAVEKTEGQRLSSKFDRHGRIVGLSANKEVFSFSTRVIDQNVVTQDEDGWESTGAFRNFMLVDLDGKWYEGWQCIEFLPTAMENDFLKDANLWTGNSVIFKNFVHPNRWVSLYGQYYFQTKLLIDRMEEEVKFLGKEIDRVQTEGVRFPPKAAAAPKTWPKKEKIGAEKSIKVPAMQVELDMPENTTEFKPIASTPEGLVKAASLRKQWMYKDLPMLRFATRSIELAFYDRTCEDDGVPSWPTWIKNAKWEMDFVVKGKRNKWNRLVLFQPAVGEFGVALRYRIYEKSERVADEE